MWVATRGERCSSSFTRKGFVASSTADQLRYTQSRPKSSVSDTQHASGVASCCKRASLQTSICEAAAPSDLCRDAMHHLSRMNRTCAQQQLHLHFTACARTTRFFVNAIVCSNCPAERHIGTITHPVAATAECTCLRNDCTLWSKIEVLAYKIWGLGTGGANCAWPPEKSSSSILTLHLRHELPRSHFWKGSHRLDAWVYRFCAKMWYVFSFRTGKTNCLAFVPSLAATVTHRVCKTTNSSTPHRRNDKHRRPVLNVWKLGKK